MRSDGKIFLNKEEQIFLMEMLEVDNPAEAVEKFSTIMVEERADPTELQKFIKKIMEKMK
jgi:hypothetical protein